MTFFNLKDRESIVVCGDIHGEFSSLVHKVISSNRISHAAVIVAGDCSFGFYRFNYYNDLYKLKLHRKLSDADVQIFMMRGNHDDPEYFNKRLIDYPFFKTVPDYSVLQTASHNILCVGGAISIDRGPRISKMQLDKILGKEALPLYWEDEPILFSEKELDFLSLHNIKIDTVITHSAPSFCPPFQKGLVESFATKDESLLSDIRKERENTERLYTWLANHNHPLRNWFYGHFHDSAIWQQDQTTFTMLNIMELRNLYIHPQM